MMALTSNFCGLYHWMIKHDTDIWVLGLQTTALFYGYSTWMTTIPMIPTHLQYVFGLDWGPNMCQKRSCAFKEHSVSIICDNTLGPAWSCLQYSCKNQTRFTLLLKSGHITWTTRNEPSSVVALIDLVWLCVTTHYSKRERAVLLGAAESWKKIRK